MFAALLALWGCGDDGVAFTPRGSYGTEVRDDLPPAGDPGELTATPLGPLAGPSPEPPKEAPFGGSLGPPEPMVTPVGVGPATTTREGSAGPPLLPPGAEPEPPPVYRIEGTEQDAVRGLAPPVSH